MSVTTTLQSASVASSAPITSSMTSTGVKRALGVALEQVGRRQRGEFEPPAGCRIDALRSFHPGGSRERGGDGAARHGDDEMRAIFAVGVHVGVEAGGIDRDGGENLGREARRTAPPRSPASGRPAGPAPVTATRTRSPVFDDEDADDGEARRLALELGVSGDVRHREANRGDQLVRGKRGLEQAGEEPVGRYLAPVGDDRGIEPDHAGGIVRAGIGIGERAADRAAVAHLRIADAAGEHARAPGWSRRPRPKPRHRRAGSWRRW